MKQSLDKVVLLGIFFLGILLAYLLTISRARINLSSPIKLGFYNVSVALPEGKNWKKDLNWQLLEDGRFKLSAEMVMYQQGRINLGWQYYFAHEHIPVEDMLNEIVLTYRAGSKNSGSLYINSVNFSWSEIYDRQSKQNLFIGLAEVGKNQYIRLDALTNIERNLAERIFFKTAKSLTVKPADAVIKGQELIEYVKKLGVARQLYNTEEKRDVYLIQNIARQVTGFNVDLFTSNNKQQTATPYHARNCFFNSDRKNLIKMTSDISSDDGLNRFSWEVKSLNTAFNRENNILMEMEGEKMVYTDLASSQQMALWPGENAIPDPYVDIAVEIYKDRFEQEALIHIITSVGQLVPTVLSVPNLSDVKIIDEEEIASVVKLTFLHAQDRFVLYYYDRQGQLIAKVDRAQARPLIWSRSDMESLNALFGDIEQYLISE